jgi:hypothetical protein
MFRRLGALVLLGIAMSGVVLAQDVPMVSSPPSRAQVLQLMAAMGIRQRVEAGLETTQNKLKATARTEFEKKHPDADAATLKKLDEIFDSTPLFSFAEITEALVPAYQKHLSAADVQAAIDFYSSEAGKRLLENLPVITRESNETGGQLVQQKLKAYSDELERKLTAFQAGVEKAAPPAADPSKAADDKQKTTDEKSK